MNETMSDLTPLEQIEERVILARQRAGELQAEGEALPRRRQEAAEKDREARSVARTQEVAERAAVLPRELDEARLELHQAQFEAAQLERGEYEHEVFEPARQELDEVRENLEAATGAELQAAKDAFDAAALAKDRMMAREFEFMNRVALLKSRLEG